MAGVENGEIRFGTPVARWVIAATVLGSGIAFLDGTIVNVALPSLSLELGATTRELQWIVDAYLLVFTGLLPTPRLAELFSFSDLHVYLTAPFVLSWSLFNALACGATVLGSDTGPVRELIEPGRTGLLADFFDVEGLAAAAGKVLDDPRAYKHLGAAGVEMVRERYSIDVCGPRLRQLFDETREIYDARRGFAREYPPDAPPPAGAPTSPAAAARQHSQ